MLGDVWRGRGGWFWSRGYEIHIEACIFGLWIMYNTVMPLHLG